MTIEETAKTCLVHQCGDAFGKPGCGCVEGNIIKALRYAVADALADAAGIAYESAHSRPVNRTHCERCNVAGYIWHVLEDKAAKARLDHPVQDRRPFQRNPLASKCEECGAEEWRVVSNHQGVDYRFECRNGHVLTNWGDAPGN